MQLGREAPKYTSVTELPGSGATLEQISMLYTRYRFAAELCEGKAVLEVACGPGIGLGYLAQRARRVIGADYDERLLQQARSHYGRRMPLLRLDAHALPFAARSFDVVILFEALYYLAAPERFVAEACRVLRPGGILLISTVNRDWSGFNPSPFTHRYLSAPELHELLAVSGFAVELYGGFSVRAQTARGRAIYAARRMAVALRLIPRTMRGKERLKRLIYGRLTPLPQEVSDGIVQAGELVPLPPSAPAPGFKVLYTVAHRP